ncbi:MAG: glycoside hydrolase family 3 N-terminal domain-containing protein [Calditrichaceae bacterium]
MIGLMTVEEKISQLSNQSAAIPRLNIPKYNYWSEALHGVLAPGTTSFPQVVALGATWDPGLVHRVASAISDEARVKNNIEGKGLSYWSPTVNIARDPRWGRNEESYSEDPYLLSQMGVAFVTGMLGDHPYYLKTFATPKHFIANTRYPVAEVITCLRIFSDASGDFRVMWFPIAAQFTIWSAVIIFLKPAQKRQPAVSSPAAI